MLVTCPECEARISEDANPCPKCGHPNAGERSEEVLEKERRRNKKIEEKWEREWPEREKRLKREHVEKEEKEREEKKERDKAYIKRRVKEIVTYTVIPWGIILFFIIWAVRSCPLL